MKLGFAFICYIAKKDLILMTRPETAAEPLRTGHSGQKLDIMSIMSASHNLCQVDWQTENHCKGNLTLHSSVT